MNRSSAARVESVSHKKGNEDLLVTNSVLSPVCVFSSGSQMELNGFLHHPFNYISINPSI